LCSHQPFIKLNLVEILLHYFLRNQRTLDAVFLKVHQPAILASIMMALMHFLRSGSITVIWDHDHR
jgi:hypothetical protein